MGRNHSKAVTSRRNPGTKKVNKAIELYNKKALVKVKPYDSQSKTVGEDFFDLMMAIHPETHHSRIEDAYYRAKTIHETKKAQGAEFKESVTTMYELMKELGVVREPEQDEGEG